MSMKLLFFFLLAFADISLLDGYSKSQKTIHPTVLSESQAAELFSEFQAKEYIPFNYPIKGCESRAMEMVRIADKKKISMAKIFVEGDLRVRTEDKRYDPVEWDWHVAPVAPVEVNGKQVLMVFDPSLFKRPVPVEEFLQAVQAEVPEKSKPEVRKVYYGSKYQYKPTKYEKRKFAWMKSDLAHTKMQLDMYSVMAQAHDLHEFDTGLGDEFDKELRLREKENEFLQKRQNTR